ncbi:hypothetical protein ABN763_09100 [Spongiivirga sp. MCCC 1A20706]|uniref:hypothetical protein n=1 Tax=Spongiivirga sp. MCCC 1A20706 TaxID=3160963 RepID=UPI0039778ECF
MKFKNLLFGTIIGTLVMFFWGATEWFNPILQIPYKTVENTNKVNMTLNENMPENGMYIWPNGIETKTNDGKAKDIVYFIAKNEADFYNPSKFMPVELVTQLIIWFTITYLLFLVNFTNHWKRVKFILIIGLLVGLTFFLPLWNWWGFSTEYVVIRGLNLLVGWFLAGTTVSYLLRNKFININT